MTEAATEVERKHPLAKCEECPLYNPKTKAVHGAGPEDAEVAFVGEAPGYNEAKVGEPFIGASGKLLDIVLRHYEIDRQTSRLTNTVLCRPNKNSTPTPAAIRACEPRLRSELESAQTVVALGRTAATAVFGHDVKITKARIGPPQESARYPGKRIIPTVHPAAILRTSDMFPYLVRDIGKINGSNRKWEPPTWKTFTDSVEAEQVLVQLANSEYDPISLDIEVGVEKDEVFTHPETLLSVQLAYDGGRKAVVIGEEPCQNPIVRAALWYLIQQKRIVCHNGKFDLQTLKNLGIIKGPLIGLLYADTMLASYALDERPGTNSLDYMGREYLGTPDWKDKVKEYTKGGSYALIPRPILYEYGAYDASITDTLWDELEEDLDNSELRWIHDQSVRVSMAWAEVEREGIRIDPVALERLEDEYTTKLADLREQLSPWVNNPNSPKQLMETLEYSFKVKTNTTDKAFIVDQLLSTKADRNPEYRQFLELLQQHRLDAKAYGTYVKGARIRLGKDGRVYPTILLHGTVTGRPACRNPNLFNVPRESKLRGLYVPNDPDNVFVQVDYKAAELRVLATEARDEYLRAVFAEGRDLHSEVAEQFFGPSFTKDQRVRAKAVVFGLGYGREAGSIAAEFKISLAEAQEYMDRFFSLIPSTAAWRREITQNVLSGITLKNHFGRRRRFAMVTRENQKDLVKEGLAFIPQSTAVELNHESLARMVERGMKVRNAVYDSVLVECHPNDAHRVGEEMSDIMVQTAKDLYTDYVPFDVDMAIGPNWGAV